MKLTFSILWFDDNPDFLDSLDLNPLEAAIGSWGFVPAFQPVNTPEEFKKRSPFKEFDLIVVDYMLGNHPHGEEFIKDLRGHGIFTEVIFYSNAPSTELWEAIYKNQLEGVFVSNRQGITDKIEKVGRQAVHKILDLNNMRGIVMAEVGEIDLILESILRGGISRINPGMQKKVYENFCKRASQQAEQNAAKLKEFTANPDIEGLISLSDSNKRWATCRSVLKRHEQFKGEKLDSYGADVLWPRNCLAHGTPKAVDAGYVFTFQGKPYKFDDAIALALRQTVMKYRKIFEEIDAKLSAAAAGEPQKPDDSSASGV